mmetsp:Transcript_35807/g.112377  ORF Transcript_35807/g.112377 Transcript_35807/m.112377 type:complete len:218 (+) Transcript_35807:153-806(+)
MRQRPAGPDAAAPPYRHVARGRHGDGVAPIPDLPVPGRDPIDAGRHHLVVVRVNVEWVICVGICVGTLWLELHPHGRCCLGRPLYVVDDGPLYNAVKRHLQLRLVVHEGPAVDAVKFVLNVTLQIGFGKLRSSRIPEHERMHFFVEVTAEVLADLLFLWRDADLNPIQAPLIYRPPAGSYGTTDIVDDGNLEQVPMEEIRASAVVCVQKLFARRHCL